MSDWPAWPRSGSCSTARECILYLFRCVVLSFHYMPRLGAPPPRFRYHLGGRYNRSKFTSVFFQMTFVFLVGGGGGRALFGPTENA